MSQALVVSPALTIPADELRWTSVRSSGPGGQNVNKVSSKVELRFDFERSRVLDAETKARLRAIGRSRIDAEGQLLIVSQATRDRQRNLEDARAELGELVLRASNPSEAPPGDTPVLRCNPVPPAEKRLQSARKRDRHRRPESE